MKERRVARAKKGKEPRDRTIKIRNDRMRPPLSKIQVPHITMRKVHGRYRVNTFDRTTQC